MIKQKEYIGERSLYNLREIAEEENSKRIFVVSGKSSFNLSGAKAFFDKTFHSYSNFNEFTPNPKIEEIEVGLIKAQEYSPDLIVGIGGGSSIDVAKAIKMFYLEKTGTNLPLVAIPTTSGSGSESTWFIVYYEGKNKISAGNPNITLPEYFILDPSLTYSLEKMVTASSSMDALSQAIESYWSINSTPESLDFSRRSLDLSLRNLVKNVNSPTRETRYNMMIASNLAGKAINISKTTACHSIAYPITSFFGIPHGHAVGLTLGELLKFNSKVDEKDCNDKRGPEYVKKIINEINSIMGLKNSIDGGEKITDIMSSIGLKTNLNELRICVNDFDIILDNGFNPERVKNNPRTLSRGDLYNILSNIK